MAEAESILIRNPSYSALVYEVVQSAAAPLTFEEIFSQVNIRRPVTTRNPRATIRSALSQGWQLVSVGDGRYGYLRILCVAAF